MKTIAVVGLGKTGESCLRYLTQQAELNILAFDTRRELPQLARLRQQFPTVQFVGDLSYDALCGAEEIVVSPGVAVSHPVLMRCRQQGIPLIGDIELFARAARAPIIAITGSNGKSTVTTLVGEMLKTAGKTVGVGGNLGTPALDLLNQPAEYYVLELSSFQLETTQSLQAEVAVVLNVSEDHLDRYESYADYIAAKLRIYQHCKNAVINLDDPQSYSESLLQGRPWLSFSVRREDATFHLRGDGLYCANKNWLTAKQLKICGVHNLANVLATFAIGQLLHLAQSAMIKAVTEFPGLAHRCEWVRTCAGVAWYNDSKGTNVGATDAALFGLGSSNAGKIILIAGGIGKNADFSLLRTNVQRYCREIVLMGRDAKLIAEALLGVVPVTMVTSLAAAVTHAANVAISGDIVLLSPACASFDMFRGFEDRGEQFKQLVRVL